MNTLKLTLAAVALTVAAASLASNANASRPATAAPHGAVCKSYLHSNVAKAKKQSKAKQRARRKWQTKATFVGLSYRKWDWARVKHYDCRKKGKWHHCIAAGYPCYK